jgi:hypothetical protein
MPKKLYLVSLTALLIIACEKKEESWVPNTDWGHWRLGHRSDPSFLEKNSFTVTFGSGAPLFEYVSREEFDKRMDEAKAFNKDYHDKGYIVLRYLSTSLNGETKTSTDEPKKEQIDLLKFFQENWQDYVDYIGAKPVEDPKEWITVRPDGTFPHYRYAPYGREVGPRFETWGCPNNPNYIKMMKGRIRAQAETGIDGSYIDWTHISGGTCYCHYCQESFIDFLNSYLPKDMGEKKYGVSSYNQVKLPQDRGDKFWMEWLLFRNHSVAEFHKSLRTVARKYNPHFMISGNIFGGFGYGPIAYDAAGNIELLGRDGYDDFIYSEMQEFLDSAPRKDDTGMKITNSPALKFLSAAAHGKPVIIYATEITPPIFPDPTEECLSAMAQINIAEAAANHTVFREKRETPPGATQIHNFLAANESYFIGANLHSNIAILASLKQYLADELSFAFSTSRILADLGIAHVMIVEDDLLSNLLNQFDMIVVPYLPLISEKKQQVLLTFVENGGNLIILGDCGLKNEYNVAHDQIPLTSLFKSQRYPDQKEIAQFGKGKVVYIPLAIPQNKFLIPSKEKAEVTTFGPAMADVFPDIPEGYTRGRIDANLRKILSHTADTIEQLLGEQITRLKVPAPYVEITTMLQPEKHLSLVHLVNYNVTVDGTITTDKDVEIQVLIPPGYEVSGVKYSGTISKILPISYKALEINNRYIVRFEADKIDIYGLAVIEMKPMSI